MNTRSSLLMLLACSIASLCIQAAPNKGPGSDPDSGRFGETYRAMFVLEPTEFGPANARGRVLLRWLDAEEGTSAMRIQIKGLEPGEYVVTAGGSGGGFNVRITIPEGRRAFTTNIVFEPELIVDPTVITRILVGTNGAPLLLGDLTQPGRSMSLLRSTVPITAGLAAPEAAGVARWVRVFQNGERTDHLWLNAVRLPPNTTFTVILAGAEVGTVTSNSRGKLLFHESVAGLSGSGRLLQLLNSSGVEALTATF